MPRAAAGLGNPGPEYRDTRHNAGFRVLDELAVRARATWRELKDRHECRVPAGGGEDLLLLKPMTFMNLSGGPLREQLGLRGIPPESCLVVCDDLALPLGTLRLRASGSSGGHHGLDSVIACLGTDAFPRLRVGIGEPPGPGGAVPHVLGAFRPEERPVLEAAVRRAADAVEAWSREGLEKAQRFNGPA